jgi:hypothetical protein
MPYAPQKRRVGRVKLDAGVAARAADATLMRGNTRGMYRIRKTVLFSHSSLVRSINPYYQ